MRALGGALAAGTAIATEAGVAAGAGAPGAAGSSTRAPAGAPAAAPMLTASGAPPFRLPVAHFAAGLAFLSLAGLALVWAAPAIARGLFPMPAVLAATHLLTLGWITLSIMGALYQFLPVALRVSIRSVRLADATFALYVPGVAVFVAGLLLGVGALRLAGAAVFGTALLLFALNLALTLRRAAGRGITWWALALADVYLVLTVVLGATLAGNLSYGYLGRARFLALAVHIHIAVLGWVLLVVIGVGRQLLPMFLLSHGVSQRLAGAAVGLVGAGVAVLVGLHHLAAGRALAALLAGAGVAVFLIQAAQFFRRRRRPKLDAGMRLAAAGLGFLLLSLLLAPLVLWRGFAAPRLATSYGVALVVGALSLFVAGHYYKILPFLTWLHRYAGRVGRERVPSVAALYSARWAGVAGALLVLGALALATSPLAGSTTLARAGAVSFALGAWAEAAQLGGLLLGRRA